jgi:hypothetical protein
LAHFNSGVKDIDDWAQKKAFKQHTSGFKRVFVCREAGEASSKGFYSLSLTEQTSGKLLDSDHRNIWQKGVPFVYVDWVACLRSLRGTKLGTFMLMDAINRIARISNDLPVYGVCLRSLNRKTTERYAEFGFVYAKGEEDETAPLMILPIWTIRDLVGLS